MVVEGSMVAMIMMTIGVSGSGERMVAMVAMVVAVVKVKVDGWW